VSSRDLSQYIPNTCKKLFCLKQLASSVLDYFSSRMLSPWMKLCTTAHKFPIRQKSNYKYCVATMLLFYILHKNYLIQTEISTSIHFHNTTVSPISKDHHAGIVHGRKFPVTVITLEVSMPPIWFICYGSSRKSDFSVISCDRHKLTNIKKPQYDHVATKWRIGQMERNWYPRKKQMTFMLYIIICSH
jgi:hypothetical protein